MSFVPTGWGTPPRRKVFVSYDHEDTAQVNGFLGLRQLDIGFDFINHKLDRQIGGNNEAYQRKVIREEHIRPASVTVILIGVDFWKSKWSNWEIEDSVTEGNGLVAIALKDVAQATLPSEFSKYHTAKLVEFIPWTPTSFGAAVERAYQNREKLKQHGTILGR